LRALALRGFTPLHGLAVGQPLRFDPRRRDDFAFVYGERLVPARLPDRQHRLARLARRLLCRSHAPRLHALGLDDQLLRNGEGFVRLRQVPQRARLWFWGWRGRLQIAAHQEIAFQAAVDGRKFVARRRRRRALGEGIVERIALA